MAMEWVRDIARLTVVNDDFYSVDLPGSVRHRHLLEWSRRGVPENSSLQLHGIVVGEDIIEMPRERSRFRSLLSDHHEYVAILRNAGEVSAATPGG